METQQNAVGNTWPGWGREIQDSCHTGIIFLKIKNTRLQPSNRSAMYSVPRRQAKAEDSKDTLSFIDRKRIGAARN